MTTPFMLNKSKSACFGGRSFIYLFGRKQGRPLVAITQASFQRQPVYKLVHLCPGHKKKKGITGIPFPIKIMHLAWLRGRDLNPRPLGYEPNELPDCSTPRCFVNACQYRRFSQKIKLFLAILYGPALTHKYCYRRFFEIESLPHNMCYPIVRNSRRGLAQFGKPALAF